MSAELAVRTRDLTRRFGSFTAVDRVSMAVKRGEIFGFLGANGAGKTTVIRMLCGLLRPTSGEATVAGFDVGRSSEQVKRQIGYMSQRFSLYGDLTVNENLEFSGGIYGLRRADLLERRGAMLTRLGLEPYAATLARALPLGFKQRLALGCAMLHEPPLLFLDEPTAGVDPAARRSFWNTIYEAAARGVTVFVTTHYMEEAEYCHRVMIMDAGRVIALDAPAALKDASGQATMQDVFIALVRDRVGRSDA